ncbi:AMP binding protein [Hysterangium stoloniferum]|nr:AMP binding protein [Hysterangium stoloniferum]
MPRIYKSSYPRISIPECSIFTQVFNNNHDPQLRGYIDSPSGYTLSHGDTRYRSLQFAWALRNILGQKKGDTMAIFSPNSTAWPIVLLGGLAAGLRVTTINSSYIPPEVKYQLEDSKAYHILTHPRLVETAKAALKLMGVAEPEVKRRIVSMELSDKQAGLDGYRHLQELLNKGQLEHEERFDNKAAQETALLCYSSGTTSRSKGAELSHYNIVSVICMAERRANFLGPNGPVMLSVLPFYHIYGLVLLVLLPFYCGTPQVIMSQFNPDTFCANIERYKATVALVVPPILVTLANHPAVDKYDMKTLRTLFCSAAPLGQGLTMAVRRRLQARGIDVMISQGWGLTEMSPTCTFQNPEDWYNKIGSVGTLVSNVEARLVLDDGQTDAAEGESGEIWVRGPNVMKGYLNNPTATRDAITSDGWFKTGDMALVDEDGYFTIVDRKKELIKYKGFQVAPAELEGILLTHPDIVDAGVIGIYSEADATEFPRAYVVPKSIITRETPAEQELFAVGVEKWIRDKVAHHKYLRGGVVIVDNIPKSAAGKILRKELRELAKKGLHVPKPRNHL